eukprot:348178-Prymnesium_polylepis.1
MLPIRQISQCSRFCRAPADHCAARRRACLPAVVCAARRRFAERSDVRGDVLTGYEDAAHEHGTR